MSLSCYLMHANLGDFVVRILDVEAGIDLFGPAGKLILETCIATAAMISGALELKKFQTSFDIIERAYVSYSPGESPLTLKPDHSVNII